jgi:hypothetical protein
MPRGGFVRSASVRAGHVLFMGEIGQTEVGRIEYREDFESLVGLINDDHTACI